MKEEMLKKYLNQGGFRLDSLGRVVVEDENVLKAINGALGAIPDLDASASNGACYNSGCH